MSVPLPTVQELRQQHSALIQQASQYLLADEQPSTKERETVERLHERTVQFGRQIENLARQLEASKSEAPQPILLTETEAAKLLGFSTRTLQGWRCRGGGPKFVRVSKACVRYRREDLELWIQERLRLSTSDSEAAEAGAR